MDSANDLKKPKVSSSSSNSSSSENDGGDVFGDDKSGETKIFAKTNVANGVAQTTQSAIVIVYNTNEHTNHQQADNKTNSYNQSRPVIYDQVQRQQDYHESRRYQNSRQADSRSQQSYRSSNRDYQYENRERREYGNHRQYGQQHRRVDNGWRFRDNGRYDNSRRNNYQQREDFNFQNQGRDFWRYQNQQRRENQYRQSNNRQERQYRYQYETQQSYELNNQANYRQQNHKHIQKNRYQQNREDILRQKEQIKPSRNNRRQRQHSRSSSKQKFEMKNQPRKNSRPNLQHNSSQQNKMKSERTKQQITDKQTKKQPQKVEKPQKEFSKIPEKQKEQPKPSKAQNMKPVSFNENPSPHQTTNNSPLNEANSHITINTNPQRQKEKKPEQSMWQPSEEEDQQEVEEKSLDKSSFECQQISLQYPLPPPIVDYSYNMSSVLEDRSLLDALNINASHKTQRQENVDPLIIRPIPHRRQEEKQQIEQNNEQGSKSIFTKEDLQILYKMFESVPLQGQTVFVELKVRTQNVLSYKIKNLSSELYLLENVTPQELKSHKFVCIKNSQKLIPRDSEPHSRNYQGQAKEKIQLKTSKLILAEIKNPLSLLNHKQELLKKFDSFEETQVIKKIEKNKKTMTKVPFMINIEQVTLKCSSCNGKKSFMWNDQIIAHRCNFQCVNFLRFDIEAVSIC